MGVLGPPGGMLVDGPEGSQIDRRVRAVGPTGVSKPNRSRVGELSAGESSATTARHRNFISPTIEQAKIHIVYA